MDKYDGCTEAELKESLKNLCNSIRHQNKLQIDEKFQIQRKSIREE